MREDALSFYGLPPADLPSHIEQLFGGTQPHMVTMSTNGEVNVKRCSKDYACDIKRMGYKMLYFEDGEIVELAPDSPQSMRPVSPRHSMPTSPTHSMPAIPAHSTSKKLFSTPIKSYSFATSNKRKRSLFEELT